MEFRKHRILGACNPPIVIPALVYLFGMIRRQAQRTTLVLLVPPIGLMTAWVYYKQACVDLKVASLISAGFILESTVGAKFATGISDSLQRRVFGISLVALGIKMTFLWWPTERTFGWIRAGICFDLDLAHRFMGSRWLSRICGL